MATSPRPMLPSPAWLLTRCRRRAARHGCPFSPRLDDRCACSHRIDRMRATAPKERAGARPTADCSGSTPKPSPIAPRGRINHASNPLERLPGSSAPGVGATDRPQARACQPELASLNRVSLPHTLDPPTEHGQLVPEHRVLHLQRRNSRTPDKHPQQPPHCQVNQEEQHEPILRIAQSGRPNQNFRALQGQPPRAFFSSSTWSAS